ncbi:hypothetical protein A2442_03975 [Candidatus Campbellbacteria bacterium RIFOXYC2_FULL_35_25]|uniref:NADAR domain-containing protein n=1 Tax=Candidatus Campbellbacteria bacterium RIFOXYC2_FULL_35_25 TaxID=1797582 RepID=A0A1F5EK24_9BACT|nr:MAG: hypothetical protein A2442_03975 [Candidatus Campbellbacteria bacterium RIFOXYC2_FULL_35_25]
MENKEPILFYEKKFYCFSNFSSFAVEWKGSLWMTLEHAYQSAKFTDENIINEIKNARSSYDSKKIAQKYPDKVKNDWEDLKLSIMEEIIRAKLEQHPYIQEKLLQTEEREIIEDSHKDAFWGWGPNKDGENHLGKLWMKLRSEINK